MRPKYLLIPLALTAASCASPEVKLNSHDNKIDRIPTTVEYILPEVEEVPIVTEPRRIPNFNEDLAIINEIVDKNQVDMNSNETRETDVDTTNVENEIEKAENVKIPREVLFEGNKIADISLVDPDGNLLISIPLFVVTDPLDSDSFTTQFNRGAYACGFHANVIVYSDSRLRTKK